MVIVSELKFIIMVDKEIIIYQLIQDNHSEDTFFLFKCSMTNVISSVKLMFYGQILLSKLYYKPHQISKLKCVSSHLAVVFAQFIEARC